MRFAPQQKSPSKKILIMTNDVSRAYLYAPANGPIYIRIPELYGTRDAAKNWSKKYIEVMLSLGFEVGQGSPCNFKHVQRQVSVTVHGDDFTSTGMDANLKWCEAGLAAAFEIKTMMLGPEGRHLQEVRVFNRVLSWTATGITYEVDPASNRADR